MLWNIKDLCDLSSKVYIIHCMTSELGYQRPFHYNITCVNVKFYNYRRLYGLRRIISSISAGPVIGYVCSL